MPISLEKIASSQLSNLIMITDLVECDMAVAPLKSRISSLRQTAVIYAQEYNKVNRVKINPTEFSRELIRQYEQYTQPEKK